MFEQMYQRNSTISGIIESINASFADRPRYSINFDPGSFLFNTIYHLSVIENISMI